MLRKIITIKNVGRFVRHNAVGDVELKRYNLIFAENGRGKTTLCAILRSLQSGDGAYINGRTTLGATDSPGVEVLLDGGATASFANGAWTATMPEIAIFDSAFVSENVHSGDVVDIDHRRGLYSVIVGSQGIDLARQINQLDSEARQKNTEIREKAASVQAHAREMAVDSFIELPEDPDIDQKITSKERDLEAARQAAQINTRNPLIELALPVFPLPRFEALLGKTLVDIASDAEHRVHEQIRNHEMAARGEAWLSEGLGYIHDTAACPFCGQAVDGATVLIAAYRSYFSQAYNALRSEISAMRTQIEATLGDRIIGSIETAIVQNAAAAEFWARFCTIAAPSLADINIGRTIRVLRRAALVLLDSKAAAPIESIPVTGELNEAHSAFSDAIQAVAIYNVAVANANTAITTKKTATQGADVERTEAELALLRAAKERHHPDSKRKCDDYVRALSEKRVIEERKAVVRTQLDEHTERVIERYERTINQLLEDFHAGFRILGIRHAYPGGVASSSYQILINNTPVNLGDSTTPIDQPSFRNTLSAGDKSTLALAFFLAQLTHDPNRASKIVLFDDPFNSQDSFRKDCTVQKIKDCGRDCTQVIVLSHDQHFLKRIWDRVCDAAERKALALTRIGELNTTIRAWDIETETQDRYKADRATLTKYSVSAEGAPRDVVQKIRPVLETYCKLLGIDILAENDTLGTIIRKIRASGSSHQLFPLCDKLEELNIYTSRYHHGENLQAAVEPISDSELAGYVRKALAMTGGC